MLLCSTEAALRQTSIASSTSAQSSEPVFLQSASAPYIPKQLLPHNNRGLCEQDVLFDRKTTRSGREYWYISGDDGEWLSVLTIEQYNLIDWELIVNFCIYKYMYVLFYGIYSSTALGQFDLCCYY